MRKKYVNLKNALETIRNEALLLVAQEKHLTTYACISIAVAMLNGAIKAVDEIIEECPEED